MACVTDYLIVGYDQISIGDSVIYKPPSISPSQWLEFWDSVGNNSNEIEELEQSLSDEISDLEDEISDLESEVNSLISERDALEKELHEAEDRIDALTAELEQYV